MKFTRVLGLGVCGLGLCVSVLLGASSNSTDAAPGTAAPAPAANPADIPPPSLVEEIVAKVNGDIVTKGDIERSRKEMEQQLRTQRDVPAAKAQDMFREGEKNILRDKIDNLLLVQKGKELNITVDTEVSKYMANLQARAKIADPEKFQQYVREQTGMPYEDFRNEIRNNMLRQRVVRQEVSGRVNLKRDELKKYYEEHKNEFVREEKVFLQEILVSTDGKDAAGIAAAERKAKDVVVRARRGDRFSDLVRDNSDSQSADQGGEIGGFPKGQLRPEIENQIWTKDKGYVTDPIKVSNGFLILKVEEHQKAGQATFEEVENEITDKFYQTRMDPAVREYLTKLREDAFLEIKPGWQDTGAAPNKKTAWTDPAQLRPETVTKEQVAGQIRKKRLLWMVPVPGTSTAIQGKSKSH